MTSNHHALMAVGESLRKFSSNLVLSQLIQASEAFSEETVVAQPTPSLVPRRPLLL